MNLFEIAASLTLNKDDYDKGLTDAEKSASGFGTKLKAGLGVAAKVGAAAVTTVATVAAGTAALTKTIVSGTKETAAYGDEVYKMSQKLGLSAEAYQEWDYVLELSGADINNMSTGLKTLTNKLDDAKNGSKTAQAMFAKLGLTADDLFSMSREDIFAAAITGFQNMADSTQRAALANDLFGKSGQELTPLFNTTAEETAKLRQEAHDLGFVMSNENVKASAEYQDSITTLNKTLGGMKNTIMSDFLPSMTSITEGLTAIFAGDESGVGKITQGIDGIVSTISSKLPQILSTGSRIVFGLLDAISKNAPKIVKAGGSIIMELAKGLIERLPEILEIAIEIITELADTIGEELPTLIPIIVEAIITIAQTLIDHLPDLLEAVITIVSGLAQGILDALPILIEALPDIIVGIVNFILEAIPQLLEAIMTIAGKITEKFPEILDSLITALPELISGLIDGILEHLPEIIQAGIDLVSALLNDIGSIVGALAEKLPELIMGIIEALLTHIPDIIEAGVSLLGQLLSDIPGILAALVSAIGSIVAGIAEGFANKIEEVLRIGKDIVDWIGQGITNAADWFKEHVVGWIQDRIDKIKEEGGLINVILNFGRHVIAKIFEGIKLAADWFKEHVVGWIEGRFDSIKNRASELWESIKEVGKNIVHGIWEGIKGAGQWLGQKLKEFFDGTLLGKIAEALGIASPSKVMRDRIGKNMVLGLAESFDKYGDIAVDAAAGWIDDVTGAVNDVGFDEINASITADGVKRDNYTIIQNIYAEKMTPAEVFDEAQNAQETAMFMGFGNAAVGG